MIVSCTGCGTRFRVSDEKVGPKRARFRCTRCKTVFTLPAAPKPTTEAAAPPGAGAPPGPLPPDPGAPAERAAGPFAVTIAAPESSDPFLLAARTPLPRDDPFAIALAAAPSPPPVLDSLALEESDRTPSHATLRLADLDAPPAAGPVAFGDLELQPPAGPVSFGEPLATVAPPGPLDFGSFDFGATSGTILPPAEGPSIPAGDPQFVRAVDERAPAAPEIPASPTPDPVVEPPAPLRAPDVAARVPAVAAPVAQEATDDARQRRLRSAWVNAVSLGVLLALGAGLFAYWRAGRDFHGGVVAGPAARLIATEVESTLYDTAAGRPVIVVRGRVRSDAAERFARVGVTVELLDGGRVVARASTTAGALPTPEEVFAVDGPASAERLVATLAGGARPLARGETAPFGAVFATSLPQGAERLTVRVTPEPEPAQGSR